MFEAFKIGITIALTNTVSSALKTMQMEFIKTDVEAAKLKRTLGEMKVYGVKAAVELGAAFAIASPFVTAITDAARLQKEMIGIQSVTRGTVTQMDQMRSAIEGVAGKTIFSSIDVAKMGKMLASGTGLDAKGVTDLLPEYAKFTDVQYILKGTSYEESTLNAIRLAHTAGHYDSASLSKYLDLLTKASFVVPGGLGEVGHALKYSQGIAKNALGIDDDNMVLMVALLNRLGLSGSRGGTNFLAAVTRTIPGVFGSGLLKGKSGEALHDMGMVDAKGHSKFFENGKFNTFLWIKGLSEYVSKEFASHPEAIARQDIMKNFQHAFGVQGGRVASLLANPNALEQLRKIGESFSQGSGTDVIQSKFANESVWQKFENAQTNFTSAMVELGWVLLPYAARGLTILNNGLAWLTTTLHDNPELVKKVSIGFIGLAGALAFSGTINLLKFAFLGFSLVAKGVGATMLAEIGLAGAVMGGILLAVWAGYEVYKHWNEIKPKLMSVWHEIVDWIHNLVNNIVGVFGIKPIFSSAALASNDNSGAPGASGSWGASVGPPPSENRKTVIENKLFLDSRQVHNSFTEYFHSEANGPSVSGTQFDGHQSYTPAGVGWP